MRLLTVVAAPTGTLTRRSRDTLSRGERGETKPYVPEGRPRGDGLEMSIIAIRSFSSYQQ